MLLCVALGALVHFPNLVPVHSRRFLVAHPHFWYSNHRRNIQSTNGMDHSARKGRVRLLPLFLLHCVFCFVMQTKNLDLDD